MWSCGSADWQRPRPGRDFRHGRHGRQLHLRRDARPLHLLSEAHDQLEVAFPSPTGLLLHLLVSLRGRRGPARCPDGRVRSANCERGRWSSPDCSTERTASDEELPQVQRASAGVDRGSPGGRRSGHLFQVSRCAEAGRSASTSGTCRMNPTAERQVRSYRFCRQHFTHCLNPGCSGRREKNPDSPSPPSPSAPQTS